MNNSDALLASSSQATLIRANDPDALLTDAEVAAFIRRPTSFLAKARMSGDGPRFVKIGGKVRYRRTAVMAWLVDCERASTSASRPAA